MASLFVADELLAGAKSERMRPVRRGWERTELAWAAVGLPDRAVVPVAAGPRGLVVVAPWGTAAAIRDAWPLAVRMLNGPQDDRLLSATDATIVVEGDLVLVRLAWEAHDRLRRA